jgi:hypothetical protein
MKYQLSKAQETILRLATQIDDIHLKEKVLSAAQNLNDSNNRATIDGVIGELATDIRNTRLVAVIGASLLRADQAHLDANRYTRKSSSTQAQEGGI